MSANGVALLLPRIVAEIYNNIHGCVCSPAAAVMLILIDGPDQLEVRLEIGCADQAVETLLSYEMSWYLG